jgi:hypothetical protein
MVQKEGEGLSGDQPPISLDPALHLESVEIAIEAL